MALYEELSDEINVEFDEAGSIGKRYRRQDEIDTPYCVTYDFHTKKKDGCVTVCERDTMEQVRMPIAEFCACSKKKMRF